MKTTITGFDPNCTPIAAKEVEVSSAENFYGHASAVVGQEAYVDVIVDKHVVRILARELVAAGEAAMRAHVPPAQFPTLTLYGPNGTVIPAKPFAMPQSEY